MDMKLKKSDINILIMLAGILLAVASYFFIFTKYTEKTAAVQGENATLQSEVDALQELADNKEFYIAETDRMNNEIQDIMKQYPADVRFEDEIMYTVGLEQTDSIWVSSLTSAGKELVQIVAETQADAVEGDQAQDAVEATPAGLSDTVQLYKSGMQMSFQTTYRSMKDIVANLLASNERMNITSLSLAYDGATGCLAGSMAANMYTMTGTGKEYQELQINGIPTGTADFFQSGTVLDLTRNAAKGTVVETEDDAEATDADKADTAEEDEEVEATEE